MGLIIFFPNIDMAEYMSLFELFVGTSIHFKTLFHIVPSTHTHLVVSGFANSPWDPTLLINTLIHVSMSTFPKVTPFKIEIQN
jgi:hypothetical protein